MCKYILLNEGSPFQLNEADQYCTLKSWTQKFFFWIFQIYFLHLNLDIIHSEGSPPSQEDSENVYWLLWGPIMDFGMANILSAPKAVKIFNPFFSWMEGYPSKDRKMTTGDGQLSESLKMVFHSISSGSVKTGACQDILLDDI